LSLLGFELLRPHLDHADAWLYRMVRRREAVYVSRALCRYIAGTFCFVAKADAIPNSVHTIELDYGFERWVA